MAVWQDTTPENKSIATSITTAFVLGNLFGLFYIVSQSSARISYVQINLIKAVNYYKQYHMWQRSRDVVALVRRQLFPLSYYMIEFLNPHVDHCAEIDRCSSSSCSLASPSAFLSHYSGTTLGAQSAGTTSSSPYS